MKQLPEHTAVKSSADLFLDTSLLQPGDVLLSRGRAKDSHWIARLTLGPFSHAAMVVNHWFLFESDDVGIGYTALRIDRVERGVDRRHLLWPLAGVDRAVVLRRKTLTTSAAEALEDDLIAKLYPAFGQEYPPWFNLASALPGGPIVRWIGGKLLQLKGALEGERVWNPGPFCSQLVANALITVLGKKGLPPFIPPREPASVNPNGFLSSELEPVPHAVREAGPSATLDDRQLAQLRMHVVMPSREESTGLLVRSKVQATMNIEKADELIKEQQKRIRSWRL